MASDSSLKFTKLFYILDNLNVSGLHVKTYKSGNISTRLAGFRQKNERPYSVKLCVCFTLI